MRFIPKHLRFIIYIYILGILFFTVFRVILLISEYNLAENLPEKINLLTFAFIYGLRFDTVISGYILSLPLILLTIASFLKIKNSYLYKIILIYIVALYSLSFFICGADIPYFKYYFSHLSVSVLSWTNSPGFMFKMVFEEWSYLKYFFLFLVISVIFTYLFVRIARHRRLYVPQMRDNAGFVNAMRSLFISMLAMFVLFLGIRGRTTLKSPIRTGTAYFSNYALPNQLGLNPVFTFMNSWLETRNASNSSLHLMDDKTALANADHFMNLSRKIRAEGKPLNANVIIIIMESMSAEKMGHFGNKDALTPNLDSLAEHSYCFNNIYSAGIHTFNGVFSTLFSFPALLKQHPMNKTNIDKYSGLANMLSDYQSIYFTTHDDQFDNVGGFLRGNGFNHIIGQKDYPSEKVLSTLGVADHYMFEYSINKLNELSGKGKPFFATFMTASDHGPYIIPEGTNFISKKNNIQQKMVEYADWSIGRFLKMSSKEKWFKNTIFVFIADHGACSDITTHSRITYDMPLSYNHVPLIIYSPEIIKEPRQLECFGGQIDVFPTIMGLLNVSYTNNTMGIDLLKEKRPYMYFSADDKIGCVSNDFYYVYRTNGPESLYKYRDSDSRNYIKQYKSISDSMKNYTFSMLQASQCIILNKEKRNK